MIKNLLALIGLAFVLFVVVGFFAKWYTFSREDGKLTVLIFTDKVEKGLQEFKDSAVNALTKPSDEKKAETSGPSGLFGWSGKPAAPAPAPGGTPASLPMPPGGR